MLPAPDAPTVVPFDFSVSTSFLSSAEEPKILLEKTEGAALLPPNSERGGASAAGFGDETPKVKVLDEGAANENDDLVAEEDSLLSEDDSFSLGTRKGLLSFFAGEDSNSGLNPPPKGVPEDAETRLLKPEKLFGASGILNALVV